MRVRVRVRTRAKMFVLVGMCLVVILILCVDGTMWARVIMKAYTRYYQVIAVSYINITCSMCVARPLLPRCKFAVTARGAVCDLHLLTR